MNDLGEVHLFVLWENARKAEERIMQDIRSKFEVLAAVPASWPRGISAATAFKRFYGTFLVDPEGKAKRAGAGEFLVVVVRDPNPVYKLVETVRGLEKVDVNIFDLKYVYRSWVGGQHRVHGTNSTEEARRDIMLLTGHPLSSWIDKSAVGKPISVLQNLTGWPSLAAVFDFLNETIPYAVLRNGEGLPGEFDPVHDDIDLLVSNLSDCVGLLGAKKAGDKGSLYTIDVAGEKIKLDIRHVGDGYYDESWQRRMLADAVKNPGGVKTLDETNLFYALVYHAVYQKRFIAADYPAKAAAAAKAAGLEGNGFDDWVRLLENFMSENGYRFTRPKDTSVSLNKPLAAWREKAVEATGLFALCDVRLSSVTERALDSKRSYTELILDAVMDGVDVEIEYSAHMPKLGDLQFKTADLFYRAAPANAREPLNWHVGRTGGYFVWKKLAGSSLAARLLYGPGIPEEAADRLAGDAIAIDKALEASGVVHRDIRPETLFMTDDGALVLTGFRFAVKAKSYSKETPWLRKDPLSRLAPLGGDYAPQPGRWNNAFSLEKCLALLPQTKAVTAARTELARRAEQSPALAVRLPAKTRIQMFFKWLEFALSDAFGANKRSKAKHSAQKRFALAAFRSN